MHPKLIRALRLAKTKGSVFLRSSWALWEMLRTPPRRPTKGAPVLVLPRLDGIGDFWLWLPLVHTIRKALPYKIHLLANPLWLQLAQGVELFDRITPIDPRRLRRSPKYRQRLWHTFANESAELLWNTTPRRRIAAEDSLAWFFPAKQRVAFGPSLDAAEPPFYRRLVDKRLYAQLISLGSQWAHEWSRYQQFAQELGLPKLDLEIYERLRSAWPEASVKEPFIAVVLGAGAPFRLPSLQQWGQAIQILYSQTGWPIWLFGGPTEVAMANELQKAFPTLPITNLAGQTTLTNTLAYFKTAKLVLGPETGLIHVAITWQKPTIVFMGGGHWGRFLPYPAEAPFPQPLLLCEPMPCYRCDWHCLYTLSHQKPYPCLARISTRALSVGLTQLLAGVAN